MQVPAAKYWCGGVERLYGGRGLAMGKKKLLPLVLCSNEWRSSRDKSAHDR